MEHLLHYHAFTASVTTPVVASVSIALLAGFWTGGLPGSSQLQLALGVLILAPAQLLRAAGLRRSEQPRPVSARSVATDLAGVVLTAAAVSFLGEGLGNPTDTPFCVFVGLAGLLHLHDSGGRWLLWPVAPREAAHRRIKARCLAAAFSSGHRAALCVVARMVWPVSWHDDASSVGYLMIAVVVLLFGDLHVESLQGCAHAVPLMYHHHRGFDVRDLQEALQRPLSEEPLGRWVALGALAQAVAHRQGCLVYGDQQRAQPQLVAEMFGGDQVSMGSARPCLFPLYLESGLEVLREMTIRALSLTALAQRGGATAIASGVPQLEGSLVSFAPLACLAAAGLAGWTSLSRSMDVAGNAQRCDALRQVTRQLCGLVSALTGVWELRGSLPLSDLCARTALEVYTEVKHSLMQLLFEFEGAGLSNVKLSPTYKRLIAGFGS